MEHLDIVFQAIKNTNFTLLNTANSLKAKEKKRKKRKALGTILGQAVAPKLIQIISGYIIWWSSEKGSNIL